MKKSRPVRFSPNAMRLARLTGYSKRSERYLEKIAKDAGFDPRSATDEEVTSFYEDYRAKVKQRLEERLFRRREGAVVVAREAAVLGVSISTIRVCARRRGISPMEEIARRRSPEKTTMYPTLLKRGRKPVLWATMDSISSSLGMSRQGIYKAAKRNGRSLEEEVGHRIASKQEAERKSAEAFVGEEKKDVGKDTVHEMGSEDARHSVIELLLSLGDAPTDELIGHAARSLAMLASRTRMSHQLFLSFVKGDGVASVEPMTFTVVESVPLMSHISPKEKAALVVALAVAYRVVMSQRLADLMLMAVAAINHTSARRGLDVLKAYFHEVGIQPSEDVLRDAKTTLSLCE